VFRPSTEEFPLNSEENAETNALILTAIKERVAARNLVNHKRMRLGNTVPLSEIFDRGAIVLLLIPKPMRLAGEPRRIFCRVIQHTRAGYQLNSK
jgi:hypothetical protein